MPNRRTRCIVQKSMGIMKHQLLAFALLGLLACSSKDEETGVNPLSTVDGFCTDFANAACLSDVVARCGTSMEACLGKQKAYCVSELPRHADSTKALIVAKVQACINAVRAAYTDTVLTAEEYETVRHFANACSGLQDPNPTTGTTVYYNRSAGQSCVPGDVCQPGNYCDGAHCIERPGVGGECCEDSATCSSKVLCVETTLCRNSVCELKPGVGEACANDAECAAGSFCGGGPAICVTEVALGRMEPLCVEMR
jgi:hypothetical protein